MVNHKKYEGITLRMLIWAGEIYYPALIAYAKEFEAETGAEVQIEGFPWYWHLPAKLEADFAAKTSPAYDIFCQDMEFQYSLWPHLLPLNEFVEKSNYDLSDLFEPVKRYYQGANPHEPGVYYGLPLRVRVPLVFYRTDLIDQFPTTWKDFETILGELTGNGRYGLGFAGGHNETVNKLFLARYLSLGGGPLLTPDGKPRINSDTAVEAMTMLKRQTELYAPPGIYGLNHGVSSLMFKEGHFAVYVGVANWTLPGIEDPLVSEASGNWSVGLSPGGGANMFTSHHMLIFKHCKHPQAAFDFIAYCTSKESGKRLLMEFRDYPARKSVWDDPEARAAWPNISRMAESMERGRYFLPWVPMGQLLEMLRALWDGVSSSLANRTPPKTALDIVAQRWTHLLEENPLDFEYREYLE